MTKHPQIGDLYYDSNFKELCLILDITQDSPYELPNGKRLFINPFRKTAILFATDSNGESFYYWCALPLSKKHEKL